MVSEPTPVAELSTGADWTLTVTWIVEPLLQSTTTAYELVPGTGQAPTSFSEVPLASGNTAPEDPLGRAGVELPNDAVVCVGHFGMAKAVAGPAGTDLVV